MRGDAREDVAAGQDSDPGSCRREQSTCSLAEAIWAGEIATYQCAFSREKADARARARKLWMGLAGVEAVGSDVVTMRYGPRRAAVRGELC